MKNHLRLTTRAYVEYERCLHHLWSPPSHARPSLGQKVPWVCRPLSRIVEMVDAHMAKQYLCQAQPQMQPQDAIVQKLQPLNVLGSKLLVTLSFIGVLRSVSLMTAFHVAWLNYPCQRSIIGSLIGTLLPIKSMKFLILHILINIIEFLFFIKNNNK